MNAEIKARVEAFEKDWEARTKIFTEHMDAEIDNRLAAFGKEQQTKSQLFVAYVDADTRAKLAVLNQQVEAKLQTLASYHETKLKLAGLLEDTRGLPSQAKQGGASGSDTNRLAICF